MIETGVISIYLIVVIRNNKMDSDFLFDLQQKKNNHLDNVLILFRMLEEPFRFLGANLMN